TAEFMPDPSLGVGKTQDNKVIVFGRYSTEYFVNAATENFAFQRVATRAIKIGIVGTHAKCEAGDAWFILGGRKEESISIHRLGVGSAEKIATREIDKILGEYSETELQASVVESYDEDGSTFIIVHLSNHVLKFNLTLALGGGTQHAWSILNTGVTYSPWRGKHGVFDPRLGKWVFGDKLSGKVGILDSTVATQYDQIAEWVLFTPFANFERQSIDEFGIETIPGFTTTDDATVFLSMTTDGVSYGMEKTIPYGAPNIYTKRFVVRRLGYVSSWIGFKLRGATRSRTAFALARVTHG
ncbi:MAG: Packaged DNA stabilization protein gp10, partial [uncultured bacterium]